MYTRIAKHAKSLWETGPFGKLVSLLFVAICAASIGLLRLYIRTGATSTITDCGLDEAAMASRAKANLDALKANNGPPLPHSKGSSRLVFPNDQFDIDYVSMSNPCDSFFSIRVPIGKSSILPNDQMMNALNDNKIGGRYDKGLRGSFQMDDDSQMFYLAFMMPLDTQQWNNVFGAIDEKQKLGASWRNGWFEEVGRIALGESPAPKEHVWQPGKDPDSVLHEVDRFLKDAGQEGIY